MEHTTLALADVVDLLEAGGWLITGGADKAKAGYSASTFLQVLGGKASDSNMLRVHYKTSGGSDILWTSPTRLFHLHGNPGSIAVYGNRSIRQQRPVSEGGGEYNVDREERLLTLHNVERSEAHTAELMAELTRLRQQGARDLVHLFHNVSTIAPDDDPQSTSYVMYLRDGTIHDMQAQQLEGKDVVVIELKPRPE